MNPTIGPPFSIPTTAIVATPSAINPPTGCITNNATAVESIITTIGFINKSNTSGTIFLTCLSSQDAKALIASIERTPPRPGTILFPNKTMSANAEDCNY